MYNQTISTTTEVCLLESTNGNYCENWQINTEKTFNYFDLIIYLLLPIITFVMIGFFRKRK